MHRIRDGVEALYAREGGELVPTVYAQGPWNPEHQHGGAVSGALAAAIEACATPVPMRVTRVVFDLMNAVPLRPLRPTVRVVKSGKRIQLVDAALLEGERPVARASALFVRVDPSLALEVGPRGAPLATRPDDVVGIPSVARRAAGFHLPGFLRAVEFRRVGDVRLGETLHGWSRLNLPVVAGEPTSPFVRLATLADFTSGLANAIDFSRFASINPDVTLHIERLPDSDWIGFESETHLMPDGTGQSHATLHDLDGPVARCHTSLYVAPR